MPAKIILTVKEGFLTGKRFVLERPGRYVLGRAECCNPQLPNDLIHRNVSRFHCLIDVCPPHVSVRDMGSRNGTFINGERIGQRGSGRGAEEGRLEKFPEHALRAGDEVRVGDTVFRVEVRMPPDDPESRTEVEHEEPALAC